MPKRIISGAMILVLLTTPGLGAPAITTAKVNFREGPGTNFNSLGSLPSGAEIDIQDCNESGSWCAVSFSGQNGFISGQYLRETQPEPRAEGDEAGTDDGSFWPRAFKIGEKDFVVLHEPQFSSWTNFTELEALFAAEYYENEEANPVFGVLDVVAQTERDVDGGSIVAHDLEVKSIDFAALDRDQLTALNVGIGKLLPTGPVTIAEERVTASLASFEQLNDVQGLKADPPKIFVSKAPARLLQTDGNAVFAPVKGAPGVEFAVNTNWDLFKIGDAFYLRDDKSWLSASAIDGDWSATTDLPAELDKLPEDDWVDVREGIPPTAYEEGQDPVVFYSNEAAEMIVFDGEPAFEAVPVTSLEWASNTETDLFRMRDGGPYYILLSGRWFSADALDGDWTFATPDLPEDFLNIPEDQPYYSVRASVPGTSEASEARLRASIPEAARVDVNEVKAQEVAYDGDPQFEPIDDTDLNYATNTDAQVIQVGARYYLVQDGVWFVADSPTGPWAVAREVPAEIYKIPPSSPVHNVTYVRVYKSEPSSVWFGFTAGYLFGFLAWGTLVYGSGWYYPPYWRYGGYPVYYPRPLSYGFGAYYNPARGTYGRYGYAYGPYRGISARAAYNPRTGTYARGARAYGPYGSRGFVSAYNPRTGARGAARGGSNIYGRWGSAGVRRGSEFVRARGVEGAGGGRGVSWNSSRTGGFAVSGRRGNIFAGRDGNVYRKSGDSWQKWDRSGWNGVDAPNREDLKRRGDGALSNRGGGERLANRPAGSGNAGQALQQRRGSGQVGQALQNRPNTGNRNATGQQRISREKLQQRRPVGNAKQRVPSHIGRDARSRQVGNQRTIQRRTTNRAKLQRGNVNRRNAGGRSRSRSGALHRAGGRRR